MTVIVYTLAGLVVIGWIVLVMWLLFMGLLFMGTEAATRRASVAFFLASAVAFVLPIAALAASRAPDPYANVLCLDGYQEWRTTRAAPMMVGKVIVPGHDVDRKVWVCRQWEAR